MKSRIGTFEKFVGAMVVAGSLMGCDHSTNTEKPEQENPTVAVSVAQAELEKDIAMATDVESGQTETLEKIELTAIQFEYAKKVYVVVSTRDWTKEDRLILLKLLACGSTVRNLFKYPTIDKTDVEGNVSSVVDTNNENREPVLQPNYLILQILSEIKNLNWSIDGMTVNSSAYTQATFGRDVDYMVLQIGNPLPDGSGLRLSRIDKDQERNKDDDEKAMMIQAALDEAATKYTLTYYLNQNSTNIDPWSVCSFDDSDEKNTIRIRCENLPEGISCNSGGEDITDEEKKIGYIAICNKASAEVLTKAEAICKTAVSDDLISNIRQKKFEIFKKIEN